MPYGLIPRELEVLRLVAVGLNDMEIGNQLFISALTVAAHMKHVAAKLGVETREQAIELARRDDLL